ncbi:methenyltetrahydromethanopterin cyclohydrolase [Rubripirellula reticaptiva]|uniref:Methenyltetrahydromethanopterin cyclohydrolase n=1 Tax=Rubripirellula reticaptiva TaxID=2528013 RepID=A0A5C6ER70_9BACT|nr:methenyltetrahydromethanopterin cyclohydrolase [Rubripirellula reticaptiva]TWU51125.1 Methenyltetrahydromethanopterin cyclohydrolase [Rubripirellula reticaptiva]
MKNDQTLNELARSLFLQSAEKAAVLNCKVASVGGANLIDAGIDTPGSITAGLMMARLCLGDRANVSLHPADAARFAVCNSIHVQTDHPLAACLGAQYAGWPVQTDDFFAMGSGPMRMFRGREATLKELNLSETGSQVVGVLESDKLPTESAIALIAEQCGVAPSGIHLAVAPSTSIAGSIQVVARSIETAMHKLHELKFDVTSIVSATGNAPLPPPAKPGDMVGGIGRTNDAMLYGAEVVLWVDADDTAIEAVAANVPSSSSKDHGRPFANIFKDYEYDFYKVDPMLFSPAVVTIHNLQSGRTWSHGEIQTDVLRRSFLS